MYWFIVTYFSICCVVVSTELQCSTSLTGHKLSMASRRNQTGHWISQIMLNHDANGNESENWVVDVDHKRASCESCESVFLQATVTAPPLKPGPDYQLLPELGYYKFHTSTLLTWQAAREVCAQEGAYLLILNSDKEFEVIKKIWDQYTKIAEDWRNNFIYVGLTDHVTEGQFVTLFGEPVNSTGYVKWAPGEPNSGTSANCAGVTRNGLLMDLNCDTLLAFFCEQRIL